MNIQSSQRFALLAPPFSPLPLRPELNRLILNFRRTNFGREIKVDPTFECVVASRRFLRYAAHHGMKGEGIQCQSALFQFTTPDWKTADHDDAWHCITYIDGVYVDFTRHQFSPAPFPTVYLLRLEVKKEWASVRKFKLEI